MADTSRAYREESELTRLLNELRANGYTYEMCLGCGGNTDVRDCGCPAGTGTAIYKPDALQKILNDRVKR